MCAGQSLTADRTEIFGKGLRCCWEALVSYASLAIAMHGGRFVVTKSLLRSCHLIHHHNRIQETQVGELKVSARLVCCSLLFKYNSVRANYIAVFIGISL